MATTRQLQEQIRDLEGLVSAYKNEIRIIQRDMADDTFYSRSIKQHEERIAWHQQMIEQMRHRRESGPQIVEDAKANIRRLCRRIKLLKNHKEIARLRELALEIAGLQEEIAAGPVLPDQCEAVLWFGEDRYRPCRQSPVVGVINVDGEAIHACQDCIDYCSDTSMPFNYRGPARRRQ